MAGLSAGKYWRMRRLADGKGLYKMMAIDQRLAIAGPIAEKLGQVLAGHQDVADFKRLVVESLAADVSALLLDPYYGYPGAIGAMPPRCGLLMTAEDAPPERREGALFNHANPDWSVGKAVRAGSDAIKLLVFYRPDAPAAARRHQEELVRRIGADCAAHDVVFVLEILDYPLAADARDQAAADAGYGGRLTGSVEIFADPKFGVDIFKMPAPVRKTPDPSDADAVGRAERAFAALARACARPWVLLSAGVSDAEFLGLLAYACKAGASGYLAGRALWQRALHDYPDRAAMRCILHDEGLAYLRKVNALVDESAVPWDRHPCWQGEPPPLETGGEAFMKSYPDRAA